MQFLRVRSYRSPLTTKQKDYLLLGMKKRPLEYMNIYEDNIRMDVK
jgi:hypothetical protein